MRSTVLGPLSLMAILASLAPASAFCSGAASPNALQNFNADPVAWIKGNAGKSDVGAQVTALAAAAVNAGDQGFGKSLGSMLNNASGDDGRGIGSALAGLEASCSDPKDPGDQADKKYIADNIIGKLLVNAAANSAFGLASGQQTASTGSGGGGTGGGGLGGGGGGTGVGPVGGGLPSGGSNSGSAPTGGTTAQATQARVAQTGSAGSQGSSANQTSATTSTTGTGATATSSVSIR